MFGLRPEVHHPQEGGGMSNCLSDMGRLHDLRQIQRSTASEIARLEKGPSLENDALKEEKSLARMVKREIRHLERKMLEQ